MLRSGGTRVNRQTPASNGLRRSVGSTRSTISVFHLISLLVAFMLGVAIQNFFHAMAYLEVPSPSITGPVARTAVPPGVAGIVARAKSHQRHCHVIGLDQTINFDGVNDHKIHLPQFGFIDFVENRYQLDPSFSYECVLPPEDECQETQFTVIFMAYNPDRLDKMYNQIFKMTTDPEFGPLVKEVVVVWNGEREVEETKLGQSLVDLAKERPVRISYPLKAGFPNDLMNRYHPRLDIRTKAIMYYDDDGPFYSGKATLGGFELWKRNANAQVGAMARRLDVGPRQQDEKSATLNGIGDRFFVSQCPTDELRYNYNIFANFGANMVLPSGSFLHRNYLACLWHPIFSEIRDYVKKHPTNPDDGTVSALVSHLSGRAPKVYSRRINESKNRRRLLADSADDLEEVLENIAFDAGYSEDLRGNSTALEHRRLMDGINWDAAGDHSKKMDWGALRSDAANSLIRYFGSVNSGSIGWCYGTPYQRGDSCDPDIARLGMLPWLKPDHTARDVCP